MPKFHDILVQLLALGRIDINNKRLLLVSIKQYALALIFHVKVF